MLLNIQYIGEHLLAGQIGTALMFVALFSALISSVFYFYAETTANKTLHKLGIYSYLLHFVSLILISGILFHILLNGYYEYAYVWKHTASYLPLKFIISAFWAGQEGSFLLWIVLQAFLGILLLISAKSFHNRVMTVMAAGQFLLTTMILGIKPLGIMLGKSPFSLLRLESNNIGSQFFQDPNYLAQITDGNGINPLLENIWMVSHPPLLFLGYAAAVVPFAYAIASLWKRDYTTWLKPAFSWTIFSVLSLAVGIILGGAWAYESLTFGGFWAWDPVENASIIPWLVLLAGMHSIIINRKRKHSYGLTYVLVSLGFILVIYASYLTRSGVLGETSAHAFGNNGLSTQMIVIITLTFLSSFVLIIRNLKFFPENKNEQLLSREFWIYISIIVLMLSSAQIFFSTSIPVINKIFGTQIAPPENREMFYNTWQLPFAAVVMLLLSFSLVLKYGKNDVKKFAKSYSYILGISILLFVGALSVLKIQGISFMALLFVSILAYVASVNLLVSGKMNSYKLGNTLSHMGIALFLIGVLAAFSNSDIITSNTSKYDLGDDASNKENQLLIKGEMKQLRGYWVVYDRLERDKNHLFYTLNFYKKDSAGGFIPQFSVHPSINVNERMGNVYDPDTYHSFSKDVFTYITYADITADLKNQRFKRLLEREVLITDTIKTTAGKFVLENIRIKKSGEKLDVNNVAIIAEIRPIVNGKYYKTFDLSYKVEDGIVSKQHKFMDEYQLQFNFEGISSQNKGINISIDKKEMEFVVIKTTVFPYISIMWSGVLSVFIGLMISLVRNIRLKR